MRQLITTLRMLWRMMEGYRGRALKNLLLMVVAGATEFAGLSMLVPLLAIAIGEPVSVGGSVGRALNAVAQSPTGFYWAAGGMLLAVILKGVLAISLVRAQTALSVDLRTAWSERIFMGALREPLAMLSRARVGELVEAVSSETQKAGNAVGALLQSLQRLILVVLLVTGLLVTSPLLTLAVIGAALLVLGVLRVVGVFRSIQRGKHMLDLSRRIATTAAESVANARQIKVLDAYDNRTQDLRQALGDFGKVRVAFETTNQLPSAAVEVGVMALALIALVVAHQYAPGSLKESIPLLALFVAACARLVDSIGALSNQAMKLSVGLANIQYVGQRLAAEPNMEQLDQGAAFQGVRRAVHLERVSFQWPQGAQVLCDATMVFPVGSVTAVVGASGRGKSTVAALVGGLLFPDTGHVLLDGEPLSQFSLRSVRRNIGYVTQEVELFHGTIAENIRMGRPGASDADVQDAARAAHADAFISAMPEGYRTHVGERGATLSGGQRQRIALARALLGQRSIYIFDEATSALDEETQALVQQTMLRLRAHAAVIVIAHRPSAIRDADQIYRLEADGSAALVSCQEALAGVEAETA